MLSQRILWCVCVCGVQGAYGAAVLYRKKDDDSLVILKEINLMDLSKQERSLALNEVSGRGQWVWSTNIVGVFCCVRCRS